MHARDLMRNITTLVDEWSQLEITGEWLNSFADSAQEQRLKTEFSIKQSLIANLFYINRNLMSYPEALSSDLTEQLDIFAEIYHISSNIVQEYTQCVAQLKNSNEARSDILSRFTVLLQQKTTTLLNVIDRLANPEIKQHQHSLMEKLNQIGINTSIPRVVDFSDEEPPTPPNNPLVPQQEDDSLSSSQNSEPIPPIPIPERCCDCSCSCCSCVCCGWAVTFFSSFSVQKQAPAVRPETPSVPHSM
jgi:hypothetical protein